MLKIYASRQISFSDYLLDEALASNEILASASSILAKVPDLIQPFIDIYLEDRKKNGINAEFGRPTIALESFILLMLLKFMHKNCDYRDVEQRAKTDLSWKAFAKLGITDKVPDYSSLSKWETFFGEAAIKELHDRIMDLCLKEKIIKGKIMRTDTTAVEANIHYPTDPTLLFDAIRTITKTVVKIKNITKVKTVFRSQVKKVKKKIFDLMNSLKKRTGQGKEKAMETTDKINKIAENILLKAKLIIKEIADSDQVNNLKKLLEDQAETASLLITQTKEVLKGVKPKDRIVSFFQPFARSIVKGKLRTPCEFGKKLEISEVEHGIISDWKIHPGNPADSDLLIDTVDRHKARFGKDPNALATDRGYWSEQNESRLKERIKKVSIPLRGYKSKRRLRTEQSKWFRDLQNFRAGNEARISQLKRVFGMNKSNTKTENGFDSSIGWGIVGCNLKTIAKLAM
jgi:transposase, IS5 family